jgi:hypothetical protein
MIAWKLISDFDTQNHLFFEKVKTHYIVIAYICSCGHTDFIVQHSKQELKYICKECENTKFYDANAAWKNSNFLHQYRDLDFIFEYDIKSDKNSITSMYITKIPKTIDFLNRKVIFDKKAVCNLKLTIEGELNESYSLRFNEKILSKVKNNLVQYINKNRCFNMPCSIDKDITLKMASFFLKNKHLKDFNFYYWDDIDIFKGKDVYINSALELISNYQKTKSVKKAIYQNYVSQLDDSGRFDSTFIEVFSKTIKDTNILVKLLSLKLVYSKHSNIDKKDLEEIICFLKCHYTEKQLLRLFSSEEFASNKYLFIDTVSEFSFNKDLLHNKFKKVSCKVHSLHDEFVRCSKEERYKHIINQKLDYTKDENDVCIQTGNYQIKLPKTGKELYEWADRLHNCMAGYFDIIKEKESIIYGFFQENILSFAVEISDNSIIQASGKYNADLTIENKKILAKWFIQFFDQTFKLSSIERINYVPHYQ